MNTLKNWLLISSLGFIMVGCGIEQFGSVGSNPNELSVPMELNKSELTSSDDPSIARLDGGAIGDSDPSDTDNGTVSPVCRHPYFGFVSKDLVTSLRLPMSDEAYLTTDDGKVYYLFSQNPQISKVLQEFPPGSRVTACLDANGPLQGIEGRILYVTELQLDQMD